MLDGINSGIEVNIFKILMPLFKLARGERVSVEFAIQDHNLIITYRIEDMMKVTKLSSVRYNILTIAGHHFERILFRDFQKSLKQLKELPDV